MKNKKIVSLIGMAFLMTAVPASAQNVKIDGTACPLTMYSSVQDAKKEMTDVDFETEADTEYEEDVLEEEVQEPIVIEAAELEVLGLADEEVAAILYDGTLGYVLRNEMEEKLPEINLSALPNVSGSGIIEIGSVGDAVRTVQQNLIELGYLTGSADGQFGGQTELALKSFQNEKSLPETGIADEAMQLVIISCISPEEELTTIYPMVYTVEKKFQEICEQTEADLEAYLDPSYRYSFDSIKDEGSITWGESLYTYVAPEGTPDIDRISFTVTQMIRITKNEETDKYELTPVLRLESEGCYRPYVTEMVLTDADKNVIHLNDVILTGDIKGITVMESAYVTLTEEAEEMLKDGKINKLDVLGKNTSWTL